MYEFKLPDIGEGVIEGEIVRWLLQPGQGVSANQALVEVMTDKATIELPSPVGGKLTELVVSEGDICPIGSILCKIEESAAASADSRSAKTNSAKTSSTASTLNSAHGTTSRGGQAPTNGVAVNTSLVSSRTVPATPAARHLARESEIDLSTLTLDHRGRITKSDVLAAQSHSGPTVSQQTSRSNGSPRHDASPRPMPGLRSSEALADDFIPFRGMRRVIAEGMVRSYTQAVHYTYVEQINMTRLVQLRNEAKKSAAEVGVSLSYLPFIIKATCYALKKFPIINAELDEANSRIILKKHYDIGIATATEQGLMVPVVRSADQISLLDVAREISRIGEGARSGTLKRDELTGSTFTISSLGTIGGVLATPILNYPEVGVLGVHAIRKTPIVNANDEIEVGHMMNLSTSFDHRVVDGFEGASFLQEVKRYLEDPTLLLLAGV